MKACCSRIAASISEEEIVWWYWAGARGWGVCGGTRGAGGERLCKGNGAELRKARLCKGDGSILHKAEGLVLLVRSQPSRR